MHVCNIIQFQNAQISLVGSVQAAVIVSHNLSQVMRVILKLAKSMKAKAVNYDLSLEGSWEGKILQLVTSLDVQPLQTAAGCHPPGIIKASHSEMWLLRTKFMAAIVKNEKRLEHVATHSDYSVVASY